MYLPPFKFEVHVSTCIKLFRYNIVPLHGLFSPTAVCYAYQYVYHIV